MPHGIAPPCYLSQRELLVLFFEFFYLRSLTVDDLIAVLGHLVHLELVKALTIDTNDIGLSDEGTRVDVVDDLEDGVTLTTLGHDEEHLHLMARVEAVRLDDRSTTMGIDRDARSYLAVLVRDDEELHTATHGVDNLIDTKRGDHQHHIAIDDLLPVVKNKIRRGDDDNIAEHAY